MTFLPSTAHRPVLRTASAEQHAAWDAFVSTHAQGHLLQSWQWGELKGRTGWSPLRLVLEQPETQQILAAAQVLRRTAPHLPLWAGYLAYIPKGPVLDWSQPALCETFLTQLEHTLRRQGAIALRIEPAQEATPENAHVHQRLLDWGAQPVPPIQPLRTILLDLSPSEETLLAALKEKWRYNVRLAARKGVTVRTATTEADVRTWYDLLRITSTRDRFGIHTLDYYLHIWQLLAPFNQVRLLLAEYQGQVLAGIFVGLFAQQVIYLYGASSNEQRHLMPNYLLQWEAIRYAKRYSARSYDFWGIPATDDDTEAMAGVYRFKSGWGGRVVSFLGAYQKVFRPVAMKAARPWLG
jgi:peptidoglycan pentaglycine glycine transferase (the first glycine)